MNWKTKIAILLFLTGRSFTQSKDDAVKAKSPYLINAATVQDLLHDCNVVVLDFRKLEDYKTGHIPNAIQIWRTDLEDTTYAYEGMMPQQEQLEKLFSKLGIKSGDRLVLYDDIGLCDASRLWWVLQNYNYTKVQMLEGGLATWLADGKELSNEILVPSKTDFRFIHKPSFHLKATKEDVLSALENHVRILDTRSKDEFAGTYQKSGAAKAGRIPGSIQVDWAKAINYGGDWCFKSKEDLEAIYRRLDVEKSEPLVVYCHSGVRSAHTTFVLTQLLGYTNVLNYDGSWVEWSHHDSLPIQTDLTLINN